VAKIKRNILQDIFIKRGASCFFLSKSCFFVKSELLACIFQTLYFLCNNMVSSSKVLVNTVLYISHQRMTKLF